MKLCAVIKAKCIKQNSHVNGSFTASRSPSQVPPMPSSLPPLELRTRNWAISVSCSFRKRVLLGQSGREKKAPAATIRETIPSMRKNHCQAWRLATLSMFSRMAAARKPEMMLLIVLPACQIAIRKGDSSFVYQADVTIRVLITVLKVLLIREWRHLQRVRPGKKGASVRPMKKRQTQKPTPLVMAGMQIVPMDHMTMVIGRKYRGFVLARIKLPGSWPMR